MNTILELIKKAWECLIGAFGLPKRTNIYLQIDNEREHRELVTNWLNHISSGKKMKYDDLELVFEAVGIKLPVKIINSHENQFVCISNTKTYKVSLFPYMINSSILIEDGQLSRKYVMMYRQAKDKTWNIEMAIDETTISKDNLTFRADYEHFAYWTYTVSFAHGPKFSFFITEPETPNKYDGTVLYRNFQQIEKYLCGLEPTADVDTIYNDLKAIMKLSEEEIQTQGIFDINVSYFDDRSKKSKTFACLYMHYGKCAEYVWRLPSGIYRIHQGDSWSYENPGKIELEYENGTYKLVAFGNRKNVEKIDISDYLTLIEERIDEMRVKKEMV